MIKKRERFFPQKFLPLIAVPSLRVGSLTLVEELSGMSSLISSKALG